MADNQPLASVPSGGGLNIVLFGMPNAGKTTLINSLWKASQAQPDSLGGKITDLQGSLEGLQERLNAREDGDPEAAEIAAYPIRLEPSANGKAPLPTARAVLIDCDGRTAEEYLTKHRNLDSARGTLARAILDADAIIVAVDPSAGNQQLEKEFQLFQHFVVTLEELRSKRNEVAGLPVYLVLTKCDKLSKESDASATWVQRIEEGKRKIDKRFREVLAKIPHRDQLAFGKVDVHMWATAMHRPKLADRPAKPNEPYGVAELFRQCFQAAKTFSSRRREAQGFLQMVVVGFLGLLAIMALVVAFFYLTRPSFELTTLEGKVQLVLPASTTSVTLFRGDADDRAKRIAKLKEIERDPYFDKLPEETQTGVRDAREQIEAYQKINAEFLDKIQPPRYAKSEEDLKEIEKTLNELAIPEQYKASWKKTQLERNQESIRKDVENLREAVKDEQKVIQKLIDESKKLQTTGGLVVAGTISKEKRQEWFDQVDEFLRRPPSHLESDPVPHAPTITYATVYGFRSIDRLLTELNDSKKRLVNLRNLAR